MSYSDDYDHGAEFAEPTATRVLRHCANRHSIDLEILDKRHGYLVRLKFRKQQVTLQSRFITTNRAIATNLAKDKVHTYLLLNKAGISVPRGDYFFSNKYFQRNSYAAGRSLEDAVLYGKSLATRVGYPLIVKPAHLKQGRGVSKVFHEIDIETAISHSITSAGQTEFMVILQEFIPGPEYRLVLVNDTLTVCYKKLIRRAVGNGENTVHELLGGQDAVLNETQLRALEFAELSPESILNKGQELILDDISNIGAEPMDVSTIHPSIVDICRRSCRELGLNYAGIDLRCADICNFGPTVVIEINSNPWLIDYFYSSAEAKASVEITYGMLLRDLLQTELT